MAQKTVSPQQKKAMAQGRAEARAIDEYLLWLEDHAPRRGRRPNKQVTKRKLAATEKQLTDAVGVKRLNLLQQQHDLEDALATFDDDSLERERVALEAGFIKHAAKYAARRRVDYASFRECQVPPDVLRRAGINRGDPSTFGT